MAAASDAIAQLAVEQHIDQQCKLLQQDEGLTDADRAMSLAELVVLLGQLDANAPVPPTLTNLASQKLVPLLCNPSDVHVQRNACALLSSLLGYDEATWRHLVLEQNTLVPALVTLLTTASSSVEPPAQGPTEPQPESAVQETAQAVPADPAMCINVLAALTAAAQGGEEGAQSIINAGALPLTHKLLQQASTAALQEAAADLLCQTAVYDSCRSVLLEQGCVPALAAGISAATDKEARVRILMCLGMLLPGHIEAQEQLASNQAAVKALLATTIEQGDMDSLQIARTLFTALAQNPACKPHIEAALRGSEQQ